MAMEGKAGVFLGTVDEISNNIDRVRVSITDKTAYSQDKSNLFVDLKIIDKTFNGYTSAITIESIEFENRTGIKFNAGNGHLKFNFILYYPISFSYEFDEDSKKKKREITNAQKLVLYYHRNNDIISKKLEDRFHVLFVKMYAHGRIFLNKKNQQSATDTTESYEVTLNEQCEETIEMQLRLSNEEITAFGLFSIAIKQLLFFNSKYLLLGTPTLQNMKFDKSGNIYKWNTPSFEMRDVSRLGSMALAMATLRCIELCNLLFNNTYFLTKMGVTKVDDLNMHGIIDSINDPMKSVIVPVGKLLNQSVLIDHHTNETADTACEKLLKYETNAKYGSEYEKHLNAYYDRLEALDWTAVYRFISNSADLKSMFLLIISHGNQSSRDTDERQYTNYIPLRYDDKSIFYDNLATQQLHFTTIGDAVRLYTRTPQGQFTDVTEKMTKHNLRLYDEHGRLFINNGVSTNIILFSFDGKFFNVYYCKYSSTVLISELQLIKKYTFENSTQTEVNITDIQLEYDGEKMYFIDEGNSTKPIFFSQVMDGDVKLYTKEDGGTKRDVGSKFLKQFFYPVTSDRRLISDGDITHLISFYFDKSKITVYYDENGEHTPKISFCEIRFKNNNQYEVNLADNTRVKRNPPYYRTSNPASVANVIPGNGLLPPSYFMSPNATPAVNTTPGNSLPPQPSFVDQNPIPTVEMAQISLPTTIFGRQDQSHVQVTTAQPDTVQRQTTLVKNAVNAQQYYNTTAQPIVQPLYSTQNQENMIYYNRKIVQIPEPRSRSICTVFYNAHKIPYIRNNIRQPISLDPNNFYALMTNFQHEKALINGNLHLLSFRISEGLMYVFYDISNGTMTTHHPYQTLQLP